MATRKERDAYRATLLRGMLTGEITGALTYGNVARHLGDAGWSTLVSTIFSGSTQFLSTSERCQKVLEALNEKYPEG